MNDRHIHTSNEHFDLFELERQARIMRARYVADGARSLRARLAAVLHLGHHRAA